MCTVGYYLQKNRMSCQGTYSQELDCAMLTESVNRFPKILVEYGQMPTGEAQIYLFIRAVITVVPHQRLNSLSLTII